jgi:AraC family transcriptional regulator
MPVPTAAVLPLLASIDRGLDDDVSLAALAARLRRSPFEVHRAVRRVTGETTKAYTSRLRLERAAVELVATDRSILEIALASGFRSHEVFTRAFVRRFRMTPRAYRARGLVGAGPRRLVARHAALVRSIGPCIGLYRMSAEARSPVMSVTVSRRQLDPRPALIIRRKVPSSQIAATLGQVLPRVMMHAQTAGVALAGQPFTRYTQTGVGMMTIEAGMPTAAPVAGAGDIEAVTLPGGPAAVAIHRGPYQRLAETHGAIERWIDEQRLTSAGAPWEVYLTDPGQVPDPMEWQTEVVYPLKS